MGRQSQLFRLAQDRELQLDACQGEPEGRLLVVDFAQTVGRLPGAFLGYLLRVATILQRDLDGSRQVPTDGLQQSHFIAVRYRQAALDKVP